MDAFKLTVLSTVIILVFALSIIGYVALDQIDNSKIPDVERGLVTAKAPVAGQMSSYTVSLSDGKVLYIDNNSALYDSIVENQTYLFNCRIDFNNNLIIVDTASLITPAP